MNSKIVLLFSLAAFLAAVIFVTRPAADAVALPAGERVLFGAGCFWGVESVFREVDGVVATRAGYSGGSTPNPTYKEVCTGRTGHAEVVEVVYDPARVSFDRLLQIFWASHDPTTPNRQGPDIGTQYRSAIFYSAPQQAAVARLSRAREESRRGAPIATEITPAAVFYPAEEYHQRYYEKQGGASCHIPSDAANASVIPPGADETREYWRGVTDDEWRAVLSPEAYRIAREAGTERPFSGAYCNLHETGTFHCVACGQAIFRSYLKFESGTGWPSFTAPIDQSRIETVVDRSHGMIRTEVRCSRCGAHLGHVFDDGPDPKAARHCINSDVLTFEASDTA